MSDACGANGGTSDDGLRLAIADIYRQVDAPEWASPNLDGLSDVLRDLSWLRPGLVAVRVPGGSGEWHERLSAVLRDAVVGSEERPHPIVLVEPD